ncbi:D-2-hydroxyacid dehydrogenase [Chloroflexota bacterium]
MTQLNVLITRLLEEECLREITAVSPEIKLLDASALVTAEERGDFTFKEQLDAMFAEAEVMYWFWPPKNVVARAPKFKWAQSMLAGVDQSLYADIINSPVMLTNMRGIHGTQISELVFEMMLMLAKRALYCFENKREKKWDSFVPELLHSKTVGIVGLGNIGKEVARYAKAFHMRVLANRRSTRQVRRARNVDMLMPRERLPELLSESDYVVLAVPSTQETYKFIGEKELRAMKPTAYLINIARGSIIDEDVLIRALSENWIAGAGLDVAATEPLPASSKLWELPNVIITPHIGGRFAAYNIVATRVFCENLRRYISGKKLLNLVDKKKGY